ncbi:magnesium and cobalt transport protein CorA [Pseudodesulfovibrio mercurii]|uniref:Magnesium transport protein CorA n=1 Tax=Pseudodesulfovibrio mercurii TaxID=641491 RepID=F0JJJ5_9BACT|nr:magnesium/cobalt transporter CorA [Pseudodesulfovibrio mercurii]EGB16094.1 magnesium and cobalt transport protein CorA [Pseudodesulfovibrio mercurii]
MARFLKKNDMTAGKPPGSLIFVGQQKVTEPRLRIIDYDEETLRDEIIRDVDVLAPCLTSRTTSWLNVDGLHEPEVMGRVGAAFSIPELILEDIVNTGHRPKMDEYPNLIFITLKMLSINEDRDRIISEQLSCVLTGRCLITFQEQPGDVFEPVRDRIRHQSGRLRRRGPDYLLYALLDRVFENYLKVIEIMGERIEAFDEEVLDDPSPELLEEINTYRREMAFIRRAVRPAREIALKLARTENELVAEEITPYLRDLTDMAEQTAEAVETYREMLNDHLNSYNMAVSNRLNDVMKFLTIFATIFIPLSFLAGLYGMNFDFMPELKFRYGYFVLLGGMGAVAVGMLLYFKKRKWI